MKKPFTAWLILPALFIDGFQAGITLSLITIPGIGELLSPAIDVSISLSMGAGLIALLGFNNMLYWQYVGPGVIGEVLPFFDNAPFWTMLVLASILKKRSEQGDALGTVAGLAASAVAPQGALQGGLSNVQGISSAIAGQSQAPQQSMAQEGGNAGQDKSPERTAPLTLSKSMDNDIKPAQKPTAANTNAQTPRAANDSLIDVDGRGRTAYAA